MQEGMYIEIGYLGTTMSSLEEQLKRIVRWIDESSAPFTADTILGINRWYDDNGFITYGQAQSIDRVYRKWSIGSWWAKRYGSTQQQQQSLET